ncbi:hypothetical protein DB347_23920 [Opitutaceae bacterium EW11]|nr:hypothetical protein DB347_23920 [Opitutaceae bacterium EW11]
MLTTLPRRFRGGRGLSRDGSNTAPATRLVELNREIAALRQDLPAVAREIERTFLGIGDRLEATSTGCARLVDSGRRLADVFGGADNPVDNATRLVRESLEFVERSVRHSEQILEGVRSCETEIARLQNQAAELERGFSSLRSIEVFFRVESASLPPEARGVFLTLTAGMANLQVLVETGFGQEFERLAATRRTLSLLSEEWARVVGQQREKTDSSRTEIEEALHRLSAVQSRQLDQQRAFQAATEAIGNQTAPLVLCLQFQDITRQKMEHVQAALETLDSSESSASELPTSSPKAEQTARLEAEQLTGIIDNLEQANDGLRSGAEAILAELRGLETVLENDARNGVVDALDETASTLLGLLERLRELVSAADAAARSAVEAVGSFSQLADNVASRAGSLAMDIHLIALNTQVQAALVANGRSLEVLAQETSRIAIHVGELSQSVSGDVAQVNGQLRQISEQCGEFQRATEERRGLLEVQTLRLPGQLRAQRETAIEAIDALRQTSSTLTEHAHAWQGEYHAPTATGSLARLRALLVEYAAECERDGLVRDNSQVPEDSLADHAHRYTSEEERRIHRRVAGLPRPDVSAATLSLDAPSQTIAPNAALVSDARATAPAEALGENVELF